MRSIRLRITLVPASGQLGVGQGVDAHRLMHTRRDAHHGACRGWNVIAATTDQRDAGCSDPTVMPRARGAAAHHHVLPQVG